MPEIYWLLYYSLFVGLVSGAAYWFWRSRPPPRD